MDSGSTPNVLGKCEVICNGEVNLGYLSTVDTSTTGKLLKATSEKEENTVFLLPVTPDTTGEKKARDSQFVLDSPLTLRNTKLLEKSFLDYDCGIFHTPIAEIVDPSAAAANPRVKKDPDECTISAARSLDFDSETRVQQGNDAVLSDEEMVESVYENLLTVILSNEIEDAPSKMKNIEFIDDGCKTPTPCLTGIAETCPGAPMKAAMKKTMRINRDSSLCRKLEF